MGNLEDEEKSLSLYRHPVGCSTSPPLPRITARRHAFRILFRRHHWGEAAKIAETLHGLLPDLCSRYLSRDDQQHALRQVSSFAADACSLSLMLHKSEEALQRIEFGRALIIRYLIDGRSDLSELAQAYPELASEYEELRFCAFRTVDNHAESAIYGNSLENRHTASLLLDKCEDQIRQKPGFEHFLRPASVEELYQCASEGPIVVVNATDISCDAIIVTQSGVEAIPLPRMSSDLPQTFRQKLGQFRDVKQRGIDRYAKLVKPAKPKVSFFAVVRLRASYP